MTTEAAKSEEDVMFELYGKLTASSARLRLLAQLDMESDKMSDYETLKARIKELLRAEARADVVA